MTSSRRELRFVLAVIACVAATIAGVSAQTYQGALRGAVRDPQGVIPGAEVTLVNEDTNAERSAMTNEVGEYAFASVLPGTYTVRVSLPGFKTEERKGFRIGTQQSLVLDFMLEVGAISEQITVTGEAPLVERASATQAASLDQEALQNLPIFGRNTFFAAISTPGVIQTGDPQFVRYQDQSGSSQLSLGGGPRRGNGYLLPHAGSERQLRDSCAGRQRVQGDVGHSQYQGAVRLHVGSDAIRCPSLSTDAYAEVLAYILQVNGAVAGEATLSATTAVPIGGVTAVRATPPAGVP